MTRPLTYAIDLVNYYKNNDARAYYGYHFILHYIRNEMICNSYIQSKYYNSRSFRFNGEFSNNYSATTARYEFIMPGRVNAS